MPTMREFSLSQHPLSEFVHHQNTITIKTCTILVYTHLRKPCSIKILSLLRSCTSIHSLSECPPSLPVRMYRRSEQILLQENLHTIFQYTQCDPFERFLNRMYTVYTYHYVFKHALTANGK